MNTQDNQDNQDKAERPFILGDFLPESEVDRLSQITQNDIEDILDDWEKVMHGQYQKILKSKKEDI